jgi:DNA-binding MurR/RpiR family transcriptional regulator
MSLPDTSDVLERLRIELPSLSQREARAARHLMANYPVAGLNTVAEYAEQSGVSTATVLRLVRRLGFSVYADFQESLRRHLEVTLQSPLLRFSQHESAASSTPSHFLSQFTANLSARIAELDRIVPTSEFDKVVALLSEERRDIHFIGGRYSSNSAAYIADLLSAVRGKVHVVSGQTQRWPQHLLDMGRNSVLVVFDVRRYQQDVVEFAQKAATQQGTTVVLFTDIWQSPISRVARHVLPFPVESPSVFDMLAVGMALGEALVGATAERMGRGGMTRMERLETLRGERAETEHLAERQ